MTTAVHPRLSVSRAEFDGVFVRSSDDRLSMLLTRDEAIALMEAIDHAVYEGREVTR